jgi:hypothetical protein
MFLKSYWKHILITVVLLGAFWFAYSKIYNRGFEAANIACEKRIQEYSQKMTEYKEAMDSRIALLEEASSVLAQEAIDSRKVTKTEFIKIITKYKDKPMFVINEAKCEPSLDFIKAYNEAVDKANK